MPLLNPDNFAAAVQARPQVLHGLIGWGGTVAQEAQLMAAGQKNVDRESAVNLLNQMRTRIINGFQQCKGTRPWNISDVVFTKLDRAQPWWGFEFETGWASGDAYRQAVTHVWDNYEGCMFDGEGEGAHAVEITFCPSEMSTYLDGTAPAYKFIEWISQHPHLTYNGGGNDVGTHLNISHPNFGRRPTSPQDIAKFLNRTLHFTRAVNGQRQILFGRETIYAGFFHNTSGDGRNQWLEFKGFRTTYDLDTFKRYIKTCAALQKVVEKYYEVGSAGVQGKAVKNLYDVAFNGADPELEDFVNLKVPAHAAPLSSRSGGAAYAFGAL